MVINIFFLFLGLLKLSKNGKLLVEMKKNNFTYDNCIEKVYGDTKVLLYNKS